MTTLTTVLTILQIIAAVVLVLVVTFQSGKSVGLGVVGGSADTFMSKGKSSTLDETLSKATKWVAVVFVLLTLALCLLAV